MNFAFIQRDQKEALFRDFVETDGRFVQQNYIQVPPFDAHQSNSATLQWLEQAG